MSIVYINFTLKLPTADAKVKFISKLACSSFEISSLTLSISISTCFKIRF